MPRLKEIKTPEIDPDLAYICGVLAGDGYIGIRPHKNEYVINCGGNKLNEVDYYDLIIAPLISKLFNLEVKTKNLSGTYGFNLYSKNLVNFLILEIGMTLSPKDNLTFPSIFLKDKELAINFIRGVADTDFCLQLKKGKYPVISGSSKCKYFMQQIAQKLEEFGFITNKYYDYKVIDPRLKRGFNIINRIELNGHKNFEKWVNTIGTYQPKFQTKIKTWQKLRKDSEGRI